ncbi:hypothetical protein ACOME3_008204 [Neoechinorhynchus agilis]
MDTSVKRDLAVPVALIDMEETDTLDKNIFLKSAHRSGSGKRNIPPDTQIPPSAKSSLMTFESCFDDREWMTKCPQKCAFTYAIPDQNSISCNAGNMFRIVPEKIRGHEWLPRLDLHSKQRCQRDDLRTIFDQ